MGEEEAKTLAFDVSYRIGHLILSVLELDSNDTNQGE